MDDCRRPPGIRTLLASNISRSQATLSWTYEWNSADYYGVELSYKKLGQLGQHSFVLSKFGSFVILSNLEAKSNYSASMYTGNNCGFSPKTHVEFQTLSSDLHPFTSQLMVYEVVLTFVVIFLWLAVLRFFYVSVERSTFVGSQPFGPPTSLFESRQTREQTPDSGVENTPQTLRINSRSSTSLASKRSRTRKISQRSTRSYFLLANATDRWKSEAVLPFGEFGNLLSSSGYSRSESNLLSPAKSRPKHSPSFLSGRFVDRWRNLSLPNKSRPPPKRQNAVSTSFRVHSSSGSNSFDSAEEYLEPPAYRLQQESIEEEDETEDPSRHQAKAVKADQPPRQSFSEPMFRTRKISEVLLGKATADIRRKSSPVLRRTADRRTILMASHRIPESSVDSASSSSSGPPSHLIPSIVVRRPTAPHIDMAELQRPPLLKSPESASTDYPDSESDCVMVPPVGKEEWTQTWDDNQRTEPMEDSSLDSYHTAQESACGNDALSVL